MLGAGVREEESNCPRRGGGRSLFETRGGGVSV